VKGNEVLKLFTETKTSKTNERKKVKVLVEQAHKIA